MNEFNDINVRGETPIDDKPKKATKSKPDSVPSLKIGIGLPTMGLEAFLMHKGFKRHTRGRFVSYLQANNMRADEDRSFEEWNKILSNIN